MREFFLSLGPDAGRKWECLQFNFMLPFEAQRFSEGETSLVRILPILPNTDPRSSFCIEASSGSAAHTQLSGAIDAITRTATPIVEFNVYWACRSQGGFKGGVQPRRRGQPTRLAQLQTSRGWTPCFPVSFILLHTDVGGVQRVLLQDRTAFNTGGDFHLFSLISGKVNDEDFYLSELPSPEYQKLAYDVGSGESDNMRRELSKMFASEIDTVIGQQFPPQIMEMVWKITALRELNAELGLRVESARLVSYPTPFLLDLEGGISTLY